MEYLVRILIEAWNILCASALYILFGLFIGGIVKTFLSPAWVARNLGTGRFSSVIKAALFGIPLPLCSCGVLPTAASLKRQGASTGATVAFLISTPETGVDSIALTYALMDPILTVFRPLAAFFTATIAGIFENLLPALNQPAIQEKPDLRCVIDGCCDGVDCPPAEHAHHHHFSEKVRAGFRFAFGDLWRELMGWFFLGLLLAGVITALIPSAWVSQFLGGGWSSMLLMVALGVPLYICATGSTPIAAAMILKGVSPGAALVFLMVGPATNITSLTVLAGFLGKRATAIYLASIITISTAAGMVLDGLYHHLMLVPSAVIGSHAELIPASFKYSGAILLIGLSIFHIIKQIQCRLSKSGHECCGKSSAGCSDEHHVHSTCAGNDHTYGKACCDSHNDLSENPMQPKSSQPRR